MSNSPKPRPQSSQSFEETSSTGQSRPDQLGAQSTSKPANAGPVSFQEIVVQRGSGQGRARPPRNPTNLRQPSAQSSSNTMPQGEAFSPLPTLSEVTELAENKPSETKPAVKDKDSDSSPAPSTSSSAQGNSGNTATPSPTTFKALFKVLSPLVWAIVIAIVLIPLAGRLVIAKSAVPLAPGFAAPQEFTVAPSPQLSHLDQDLVNAIQTARQNSRDYAASELDNWLGELDPRVDSFLDWYFDYFNQKKLEISAPIVWLGSAASNAVGIGKVAPNDAVNAKLTEAFQKEFTKRVLVPQTAQLRFEVITTEAAAMFVADLSQQISKIQGKYRIPQGQWERYLDTIATTVSDTEGNISNLSLKAIVGGTGYLAAKPFLLTSIGKVGSKVSAKFTASATAKLATKTGTSVAAELGTSLIDPIVGIGIVIWDLWDYNSTVAVDRPLLSNNIDGYLKSMERSLLDNPETGIMAAINQLESNVVKGVKTHR